MRTFAAFLFVTFVIVVGWAAGRAMNANTAMIMLGLVFALPVAVAVALAPRQPTASTYTDRSTRTTTWNIDFRPVITINRPTYYISDVATGRYLSTANGRPQLAGRRAHGLIEHNDGTIDYGYLDTPDVRPYVEDEE